VGNSYLGLRVAMLRTMQNPDGGWGYFPGKKSWLEPTLFTAMALHGEPAADRAWRLVSSWQQQDGSWRPQDGVQVDNAGTALCVTMACVRGEFGEPFRKGVEWLLSTVGVEFTWEKRVLGTVARWFGVQPDRDQKLTGWPWKPDEASWVEPTAHALVALKKASNRFVNPRLRERVRLGEAQLFDVRCKDGGWNYGAPIARGVDLPSYPETTALALLGLQGRPDLGPALDQAARLLNSEPSPLARAWLRIALQVNGAKLDMKGLAMKGLATTPANGGSEDVLIAALEALGAPEGNHCLLKVGTC
jgi:hypothetical protein